MVYSKNGFNFGIEPSGGLLPWDKKKPLFVPFLLSVRFSICPIFSYVQEMHLGQDNFCAWLCGWAVLVFDNYDSCTLRFRSWHACLNVAKKSYFDFFVVNFTKIMLKNWPVKVCFSKISGFLTVLQSKKGLILPLFCQFKLFLSKKSSIWVKIWQFGPEIAIFLK